ncbi:alpha/beta fold hydrolase (macronuclear) [Tetrahymena thermophila SB210]|uniref:Alpha/beta fold hydrolase n=1 Tax=Tetrahymena thermophila (strain SB210) TaxID=312017 RepID=Q229Y8_TETTS|nr:alpha/beta fold hydrolase [Tetrahymena thermophila SB210]EAR82099.1 alpha/beta fold hydrolase [Tetrahymena thermophila SB210]|eukprot:XP_001029762.1 alpha/beta fold hydrolase [Tetrahymena thermophila SB210]
MRFALNFFKFSTHKLKPAKLHEYHIPAFKNADVKFNALWLHGIFDNSKNFLQIAQHEKLRKNTHSTLLDLRNHGLSQHLESISFEEMAYDLVHYIAQKDLKDLILLGHSFGGRTIMAALNDYQQFLAERVKGVIIIDIQPSSYAYNGAGPVEQMYRFMSEMKSINIHGKTLDEVRELIQSKFDQVPVQKTMLNNINVLPNGQLKWCLNFNAIDRCFNNLISHETKNCYWKGPRKILIGGKSKFTSLQRVQEDYPSVFYDFNLSRDVSIFWDQAHFLYARDPERFVKEVAFFMESLKEEQNNKEQQIDMVNYNNDRLSLEI